MITSSNAVSVPQTRLLLRVGIVLAALLLAALLFYRLDAYPAPNFDEGAYINVARTFVREGIYAESSVSGYSFKGAVVSTGPTVLLPIAGMFAVFGVSVTAARLVMVAYSALLLVALYGVARTLGARLFAALVIVLALFGWGIQVPYAFRSVNGEIPGMALLLAGLWLWFSGKSVTLVRLTGVGVLFGLACITKTQFAIILLPAIAAAGIMERLLFRQRSWLYYILPGVIAALLFLAWFYYSWYLLGGSLRDASADAEVLVMAGSNSYFVLEPETNYLNFAVLSYGTAYAGLFVPAALVGALFALRRTAEGSRWRLLVLLLGSSALLFIISIGWLKNTIPALLLAALFVGKLLYEALPWAAAGWRDLKTTLRGQQSPSAGVIVLAALAGLSLVLVALPMLRALCNVALRGGDAPYRVADYLNAHVPLDALIETWDKELLILSDHRFHVPPQVVETYRNLEVRERGEATYTRYDFRDYVTPDYVIVGASSRKNGVYPAEYLEGYTLLITIGEYEIFRRESASTLSHP